MNYAAVRKIILQYKMFLAKCWFLAYFRKAYQG